MAVDPAVDSDADRKPLIRSVDAIQIPVPALDEALAFYRDRLGHELIWRDGSSAGLRMPESEAELLLVTARPELEPDLVVDSAGAAAERWVEAGGTVVAGPEEIAIGRLIVVRDPWGNRLVLLDRTKGRLVTDDDGNVLTDGAGAAIVGDDAGRDRAIRDGAIRDGAIRDGAAEGGV